MSRACSYATCMYVGGCQQLAELDTGSVGKKFCRGKYDRSSCYTYANDHGGNLRC